MSLSVHRVGKREEEGPAPRKEGAPLGEFPCSDAGGGLRELERLNTDGRTRR